MAQKRKTGKKWEEKKQNQQVYWILGIMAGVIVLLLLISWMADRNTKFTYEGLTFTKERYGSIPVFHYYYNFEYLGQKYKYNLYLREDPRKNEVPVSGEIGYDRNITNFISVNATGLDKCNDSSMAIYSLDKFLLDNQFQIKSATPDYKEVNRTKVPFASCDSIPVEGQVIVIQEGSETKIEKINDKCYVIQAANCEILKAVEKFEVQSILDAKNRA